MLCDISYLMLKIYSDPFSWCLYEDINENWFEMDDIYVPFFNSFFYVGLFTFGALRFPRMLYSLSINIEFSCMIWIKPEFIGV